MADPRKQIDTFIAADSAKYAEVIKRVTVSLDCAGAVENAGVARSR